MSEDSGQHWRNQVEAFEGCELRTLMKVLNDFFKDKFVIATQIFPKERDGARYYDAVVYFKVPPLEQKG